MIRSRLGKQILDHQLLGELRDSLTSGNASTTIKNIITSGRQDKGAIEVLCRGYALQNESMKMRLMCEKHNLNIRHVANSALQWGYKHIGIELAAVIAVKYKVETDIANEIFMEYFNQRPSWLKIFPLFCITDRSDRFVRMIIGILSHPQKAETLIEVLRKPLPSWCTTLILQRLALPNVKAALKIIQLCKTKYDPLLLARTILYYPKDIDLIETTVDDTHIICNSTSEIDEIISMFSCKKQNVLGIPLPRRLIYSCLGSYSCELSHLVLLSRLKGIANQDMVDIKKEIIQKSLDQIENTDQQQYKTETKSDINNYDEFVQGNNHSFDSVYFPDFSNFTTKSDVLTFTDPSSITFMRDDVFTIFIDKLTWLPNGDEFSEQQINAKAVTFTLIWLSCREVVTLDLLKKICSLAIRCEVDSVLRLQLVSRIENIYSSDEGADEVMSDTNMKCLLLVLYSRCKHSSKNQITTPQLLNSIFDDIILINEGKHQSQSKQLCKYIIMAMEGASVLELYLERDVKDSLVELFIKNGIKSPKMIARCTAISSVIAPASVPHLMRYFLSCASCEVSSPYVFAQVLSAAAKPSVAFKFASCTSHYSCCAEYRGVLVKYIPIWLESKRISARDWTDLIVGAVHLKLKLPTSMLKEIINFITMRSDVLNLHLSFVIQAMCLFGDSGLLISLVIQKLVHRHNSKIEKISSKMASLLVRALSDTGVGIPPELISMNTRATSITWKLNPRLETFYGEERIKLGRI